MALLSHGHKVSVIALRDPGEAKQEMVDGVKIYRAPFQKKRRGIFRYLFEYAGFFLYSTFKLNVLDLKERFNVIHINTLPDFLVFSAFIQKLKGRRIILDMHEISPEFFMSKFEVGTKHPIVRLLLFIERISLRFADDVITVNEPIKQVFHRRAIPNKTITVVMNTMDGAMENRSRKRPHNGFNCVYHGTLTDIYGLDIALEGFSRACKHFNDMVFHIFGSGPHLQQLRHITEQLNLQDYVIFHDAMPHDKMLDSLSEMDLGILSARKDIFLNLSFSNKLAEYVGLKIPVICSDLDTTRYYFTDENILYFESGNVDDLCKRILFAYNNRDRMQRMAEAAYERSKAINWTIMAERYLKVIERRQA